MPPISLLIKPASAHCNMRCKYCFYADVSSSRSVKNYEMMSFAIQEQMIAKAFLAGEGGVNFIFQGGEPTLCGLEYFRQHIALVKKYNTKKVFVQNAIQTNGYTLDDEWAEFFHQEGFLVGISLDGSKSLHDMFRIDARGEGTYARVMQSIQLLKKHHVEFNILCVVNNLVAKNAEQVLNFFLSRQLYDLQFIPCIDPFVDTTEQDYSLSAQMYAKFLQIAFEKYYKHFPSLHIRNFDNYVGILLGREPESCDMRGSCACYYVIEGDGSIFPCDFYVLDAYKIGHVLQDDLSTLFKSEKAREFMLSSRVIAEECKSCAYFSMCRGGCRRYREPNLSLNKYCYTYQTFFTKNLSKLQELAKRISFGNI